MDSNFHERRIEHILPDPSLDPYGPGKRKRVAAYARVSTDQEAQESSFLAQVSYYIDYITKHDGWRFIKVYADRGLSGTSYKRRPEFRQMITDAKAGKIDLIVTKSISRFARNTVDSLNITRELKEYGVEVYFEKEEISSFDADAELVFTVLASVAQEESHSISENVKWRKRRDLEAGKINCPYKNILGYKKGKNDLPEIVEEEAKVVRKIYQLFLNGASYSQIAKQLTDEGILTPARRLTWRPQAVTSILTNEMYKGDVRLGKTYIEDFLTKKVKKNHGERFQLYIHDSHDAIIPPEIFDNVQKEIERRKQKKYNQSRQKDQKKV